MKTMTGPPTQAHIEDRAMTEENHEFQVPAEELRYLQELALGDESLASLVKSHLNTHGSGATVRLTRVEAEKIRDCLTARLAAVGFDEHYSPNQQGQMLEKLIDRFHVWAGGS